MQGRHALSRFVLEVDGVTWSLCHERKPFIEIALATILLDSTRHRDRSGQSSLSRTDPALDDLSCTFRVPSPDGVLRLIKSEPAGAVALERAMRIPLYVVISLYC